MSEKKYKMIHPETDQVVHVSVPTNIPAADSDYQGLLLTLWECLSDSDGFTKREKTVLLLALEEFDITFDEAYHALWQAFADPYVAGPLIQFRHMWKWIDKKRKAQAGISYHEALRRWHEKGNPGEFTEHFKSFIDRNGTRLWRPTNEE